MRHADHHLAGSAMTTIDRAAIRHTLQDAWTRPRPGGLSLQAQLSDALTDTAQVSDGLYLVDEFRPAEWENWEALRSAAITRVHRAAEIALLDALADAVVVFATEHPAAPRRETAS
jgi:hypothetical protein